MKKILVVYYSYEGHTEHVAYVIAQELSADVLQIKPIKEMSTKGFGKYLWGGSQVYMKKIPKLEPIRVDFSKYDTIFVGSPIWAWSLTPPIKSFILNDYLIDKDLYFFYTHEGGPGKVEKSFKIMVEKKNRFLGTCGFIPPKNNFDLINQQVYDWLNLLNIEK